MKDEIAPSLRKMGDVEICQGRSRHESSIGRHASEEHPLLMSQFRMHAEVLTSQ